MKNNKKKLDGTNYEPGCSCCSSSLEPNDLCYIHGIPNITVCPYCGQFRGRSPCKRCGCSYGLSKETGIPLIQEMLKSVKTIIEDMECWLSKPERDYMFNLLSDTVNIHLYSKDIYKELYNLASPENKKVFPKRLR